jgi:SAM-dependent methyltransferase
MTPVPSTSSYSRFRFLSQSLSSIDENEQIRRPEFPFSNEVNTTRYPVRALRYWWLNAAVHEEAARLGRGPSITDIGCDTGIIKRFILPVPDARWTGLDIITDRKGLEISGYDEVLKCDLDEGLPVADASQDIVICSHVLEHLPRPEFTVDEIVRVLKPGGMLLVGVPIAPKLVADMREKQFRKQLEAGTRVSGQHIHMFSIGRINGLLERAGLAVEFMSGTALMRKKGSRLENYAAWIRFNQLWAAAFPSLGQELCIQARKPL